PEPRSRTKGTSASCWRRRPSLPSSPSSRPSRVRASRGAQPGSYTGGPLTCQGAGARLRLCEARATRPITIMRVHLHPQGRVVDLEGRRSVGCFLAERGILPGTAMVIRGDMLLLDGEMVEDDDVIEVRAVISGGTT